MVSSHIWTTFFISLLRQNICYAQKSLLSQPQDCWSVRFFCFIYRPRLSITAGRSLDKLLLHHFRHLSLSVMINEWQRKSPYTSGIPLDTRLGRVMGAK